MAPGCVSRCSSSRSTIGVLIEKPNVPRSISSAPLFSPKYPTLLRYGSFIIGVSSVDEYFALFIARRACSTLWGSVNSMGLLLCITTTRSNRWKLDFLYITFSFAFATRSSSSCLIRRKTFSFGLLLARELASASESKNLSRSVRAFLTVL